LGWHIGGLAAFLSTGVNAYFCRLECTFRYECLGAGRMARDNIDWRGGPNGRAFPVWDEKR
jgi:hypothetical protein